MGFFKKLVKAANPIRQTKQAIKDPGQALKNSVAMGLDPAGSVVRMGRGQEAMPGSFEQAYDPGGFFEGRPPTNYQPYQAKPMNLSPKAQALYDQMKARTAARNAAKAQGQSTAGVGFQQQPVAQQPQVGRAPPVRIPTMPTGGAAMMADGGKVQRREEGCDEHSTLQSKVINRKPNGKPY